MLYIFLINNNDTTFLTENVFNIVLMLLFMYFKNKIYICNKHLREYHNE